jgi:hypothetical protein
MVHHYKMKELWLGDEYPLEEDRDVLSQDSTIKDQEADHQGSSQKKNDGNVTDGANSAMNVPLKWDHPSRSGVFTIQDSDLSRVTSSAMKKQAKVNIFVSDDFWTNKEKLLVIVQGSGAVRPGQWARALCINHSLKSGTIFDYLDIARECGMATIVLNPNQERLRLRVVSEESPLGVFSKLHDYPILGHENHVKHILHVWDHFVTKSPAKEVWMVAHSRGGDSALQLLNYRLQGKLIVPKLDDDDDDDDDQKDEDNEQRDSIVSSSSDDIPSPLKDRLLAIAFTDSVHWIGSAKNAEVVAWMKENAKDWVASASPLDTPVPSNEHTAGCACVSAGHTKHEWTSPCAVNSVFDFFLSKSKSTDPSKKSFTFSPRQIPFSNPPQHISPAEDKPTPPTAAPSSTASTNTANVITSASQSSSTSTSADTKSGASSSSTTTTTTPTTTTPTSSTISFTNGVITAGALAASAVALAITVFFLRNRSSSHK